MNPAVAAINDLIGHGVRLPRIASFAGVSCVAAVREWHAGIEPPDPALLRLTLAARLFDGFLPIIEKDAPPTPPPAVPMSIGEARRAIACMERAGFTLREIARGIGVSRESVVNWRTGSCPPDAKRSAALRVLLTKLRNWQVDSEP